MGNSVICITYNPNPNRRFYQLNVENYSLYGTRDKNRSLNVQTSDNVYFSVRMEDNAEQEFVWG